MGLVLCTMCGEYNQSTQKRCSSCSCSLFGEVVDNAEVGNDTLVYTTISGCQIKNHSFQNAKIELKRFSEQSKAQLELTKIKEQKGVGEWLGDFLLGRGIGINHVVKGEELQKLSQKIQEHLQSLNDTEIKIIDEFKQIYNALEVLDKDYIHDIILSIQCTEKTAEEAKQAGFDALKALKQSDKTINDLSATQEKLKIAQRDLRNANEDIKATTIKLEKTIIALSKFKSELDKISHLKDIDKLWNDFQATKKNIPEIEKKLHTISDKLENHSADVAALIKWKGTIDGIDHIEDVDALWDDVIALRQDVQSAKQYIEQTGEDLKSQSQSLQELSYFINQIKGYEHLSDVDKLWSDFHTTKNVVLTNENLLHNISDQQEKSSADVAELMQWKSRIDNIEHVEDVDAIWNDFQSTKKIVLENENELHNISEQQEKFYADISTLLQWKASITAFEHIKDVDKIWGDVVELRHDIGSAEQQIKQTSESFKSQGESLQEISNFINSIKCCEHLNDVDEIWNKCSAYEETIRQTEATMASQQKKIDELNAALSEMQSSNDDKKSFSQKLNIAYILSGTSLGIAVIEFIMLLLR